MKTVASCGLVKTIHWTLNDALHIHTFQLSQSYFNYFLTEKLNECTCIKCIWRKSLHVYINTGI